MARLNLPNMSYPPERKLEVYATAVRGLTTLEPDPERRLKYLDFIDIYSALDDNEIERYRREYPEEAETMSHFAERFREQGIQQGLMRGEVRILSRLLEAKFGPLPEEIRQRLEEADEATLLAWSERVLTAQRLEQVLH